MIIPVPRHWRRVAAESFVAQTAHVQAWFARLPELAEGGVHVVRMRVYGAQP